MQNSVIALINNNLYSPNKWQIVYKMVSYRKQIARQ